MVHMIFEHPDRLNFPDGLFFTQQKRGVFMKQAFLFSITVATFLSSAVSADTQTITTQGYVDTQVATKQDKISAIDEDGWVGSMPVSVITDTDTDGVVAKRFIIEGSDNGGGNGFLEENENLGYELALNNLTTMLSEMWDAPANELKKSVVSVGVLDEAFEQIQRQLNYRQTKKRCVRYLDGAAETSENCLLWDLPD